MVFSGFLVDFGGSEWFLVAFSGEFGGHSPARLLLGIRSSYVL